MNKKIVLSSIAVALFTLLLNISNFDKNLISNPSQVKIAFLQNDVIGMSIFDH